MLKKADTQLIKLLNEIQILNLIREEGPISRIEIARRIQMSKVAVFEIINRLIDAGFVIDVGKGESTSKGGKRPSLVKLNPENHYVIGIEFRRREAQISLANIEAEIINSTRLKYPVGAKPEEVFKKVFRKINNLLKNAGVKQEQLISIGMGVPGLIDYQKGQLRFADTLRGWAEVPIAKIFSEKFNVPTFLENDVNTITLGESILGAGREESDLACVWVGEGLGAGLIVNNQLIQGFGGGAGELGYLVLDRFCEPVQHLTTLYRGQKYFGDILSESYLQEVLINKLAETNGTKIKHLTLERLLRSKNYLPLFRDILDEFAYLLGIACSTLIKIVNPKVLILSGKIIDNSPYVFDRVREFIKDSAKDISFFSTKLVKGELKDEAGLRGAIALALQVIF